VMAVMAVMVSGGLVTTAHAATLCCLPVAKKGGNISGR
jgi:hypothetical protein